MERNREVVVQQGEKGRMLQIGSVRMIKKGAEGKRRKDLTKGNGVPVVGEGEKKGSSGR